MTDFSTRLCEALEIRHMTAAELSRKLNINEGTISQYKKGLYEPKQRRLQAIAEVLNVSIPWLMGGDVPMETANANITTLKKVKYIPILGDIACGEPILAEENIVGRILLPENIHADYALECKGDSMINAKIDSGDIVYIRQQSTVDNGEIAAVLIDNEATLKKVFLSDNSIKLVPANDDYEPFIYFKDEMNNVRILGKAVAVLKHLE